VTISSCDEKKKGINNSSMPVQPSSIANDIRENKDTYLSEYFPNSEFVILPEKLNVKHREISFAVHYINESDPKICDIVVGFEYIDGIFHRYLLIKDFKFINKDNSVLIDFSRGYDDIYGFDFSYSYPKVAGYSPGLNIDTYFDEGRSIADGFLIEWNEDKKRFEKVDWL
jgi:hypothetical protein